MNVAVYPYSLNNSYIMEYEDMFQYEVKYYIVAGGILPKQYKREDQAQEKSAMCTIQDIFTNTYLLINIDALCLIDSIDFNKDELLKVVEFFCSRGKKIVCTAGEYGYGVEIDKICNKYSVEFICLNNKPSEDDNSEIELKSKIYEINTPIITVMGLGRNVQKFNLQLYLRKYFKNKDYKISQLGTNHISELFDFYVLPSYIYTNEFSDVEKIIKFNHYVKSIEKKEKPDIIIIGIPDSILPLNKKHRFSFGLYAFEILNAIHSDYTIMSVSSGEYNDEFYNEIYQLCKYRFNVEVDAFYISQFAPISNSIWLDKLIFGYMQSTAGKSDNYKVYHADALKNDCFFSEVEKKLLLYGKFEQF